MKAICRYTGLELLSSSGFARWNVVSEHPIFAVPLAELVELAATNWSPEMFVLDKKLLMLAIAKNCRLVNWEHNEAVIPATPSMATVESSIQMLLQIAGWIDYQRFNDKDSCYPSLHITEESADMRSFAPMLKEIFDSRDYTEKQEKREHRLTCLEHNAKNLSARCRIGDNKETALLNTTAEWALTVTEDALDAERVGQDIRTDWKSMLMTSATKIKAKGFSIADVEELRDFMTDNLPHGSVIAHDVIAHLHRLVEVNAFSDIDGGAILGARILSSGNLVAVETEPKREDYASILEYARARATWLLVEHQREETTKEMAQLIKLAVANKAKEQQDENDI